MPTDKDWTEAYNHACEAVGKRLVDNYLRAAAKQGRIVGREQLQKFEEMTLRRKEIRRETRNMDRRTKLEG